MTLARRLGVGYVATNNVHYATPAERSLHDVLTCIRTRTTLDDCPVLRPTAEYYLKSADEMRQRFAAYPLALRNTLRIAERCQFRLHYGLQDLPAFPAPDGLTMNEYLRQLCAEGLRQRLPDAPERATVLLHHELDLIRRAGLSNYFLIVWDVVRSSAPARFRATWGIRTCAGGWARSKSPTHIACWNQHWRRRWG